MRILAGENFPRDAVRALRDCGHDVVRVLSDARGSSDVEVLERVRCRHISTLHIC